MTTFRTRLIRGAAVVAVVVGVALALAAPASAEAGPGYPPAPGDDPVVDAGGGVVAGGGAADDLDAADTEIGDAAHVERPADEIPADEGAGGTGDDREDAVQGTAAGAGVAPTDPGGRGAGAVLVVVVAAAVLGGAIVGIARRI